MGHEFTGINQINQLGLFTGWHRAWEPVWVSVCFNLFARLPVTLFGNTQNHKIRNVYRKTFTAKRDIIIRKKKRLFYEMTNGTKCPQTYSQHHFAFQNANTSTKTKLYFQQWILIVNELSNYLEVSSQSSCSDIWPIVVYALFDHTFYTFQFSFSHFHMSVVARHLISLWSCKANKTLWSGIRKAFCGKNTGCYDLQHAAVNQIKRLFPNESQELQEGMLS